MIRHIVMWKLKDAADAPHAKRLLDSCERLVDGVLGFEVAIRQPGLDATADVVLVSTFVDRQALAAYQNHPQHKALAAQLAPLRDTRQVFDYEVADAAAAAFAAVGAAADPRTAPVAEATAPTGPASQAPP